MPDIQAILDQMTLEEKAALCTGASMWTTVPVERLGVPAMMMTDGPHGVRRVPDVTSVGAPSLPATCFPTASCLASSWDLALLQQVGAGAGRRGRCARRGCAAGTRRQHEAHAALRTQLRVLLGRPLPGGRAGRRFHQWRAEQGRGHVTQAFCGQQPGDRALPHRRHRRRAHPPRDLPARLRDGGQKGQALDRDVRLQQAQRRRTAPSTTRCSWISSSTSGASTDWWSPTGARCTTG